MKVATINWKLPQSNYRLLNDDLDGFVNDICLFSIAKRGKRNIKYILYGYSFSNCLFPRANNSKILATSDNVEKLKKFAQERLNEFVDDFIKPDSKLDPATLTMLTMYYAQANPDRLIDIDDTDILLDMARKFEKKYKELDGKDWEDSRRDYIIEVEDFVKKHLKLFSKLELYPEAALEPWDNIEMNGCMREKGHEEISVIGLDDDQEGAEFWSVYLHQAPTSTDGGGVQCIADFPTEQLAIKFKDLLTNAVKNYSEQGHLK